MNNLPLMVFLGPYAEKEANAHRQMAAKRGVEWPVVCSTTSASLSPQDGETNCEFIFCHYIPSIRGRPATENDLQQWSGDLMMTRIDNRYCAIVSTDAKTEKVSWFSSPENDSVQLRLTLRSVDAEHIKMIADFLEKAFLKQGGEIV